MNVKLIGANNSKAGPTILKLKNDSVKLKHADILELLENKYAYRVEFDPVPSYKTAADPNSLGLNSEMVGKQTTLNHFLKKRKSPDGEDEPNDPANNSNTENKKQKMEKWLEVDGGKLIVFTSDGLQHKSKVGHLKKRSYAITNGLHISRLQLLTWMEPSSQLSLARFFQPVAKTGSCFSARFLAN